MKTVTVKPGDVVRHLPSGEEWIVGAVNIARPTEFVPLGWPMSIENTAECELIYSCSEERALKTLKDCAELRDGDIRGIWAREALNGKDNGDGKEQGD